MIKMEIKAIIESKSAVEEKETVLQHTLTAKITGTTSIVKLKSKKGHILHQVDIIRKTKSPVSLPHATRKNFIAER